MSKINLGGYFVHFRNQFGRCSWAFVTSQHSGTDMNLKEVPDGPDGWMYRPAVRRGAGKGCYHAADHCNLTDNEIELASAVMAESK